MINVYPTVGLPVNLTRSPTVTGEPVEQNLTLNKLYCC